MIAQNSLKFRYLSIFAVAPMQLLASALAEPLPYADYYNPAQGFKPAQANLSRAFLKLAGSLEHHGSPEPYLRHVMAEHARIDAAHHAAGGKGSSRPAYLTDDYLERLLANWKKIQEPLKLEEFCREAGRNMRYAILGTKNMAISELIELETNLTNAEKRSYRTLLEKPHFKKSDFASMNAFYEKAFDKLTKTGQDQISRRTWLGTLAPETREKEINQPISGTALARLLLNHQDATVSYLEDRNKPKTTADTLEARLKDELKLGQALNLPEDLTPFDAEPLIYAHKIRTEYLRRTEAVRKTSQTQRQAAALEKAIRLMIENLCVVVQSEFEAAVYVMMTGD